MGINLKDWSSFSDAERKKIEDTLGITLADYTTADEREAVLMEFEMASRRQAEIQARKGVIDHYFNRQEQSAARQIELEVRVLPPQQAQRYLPEPPAHVEILPVQVPPRYSAEVFQPVIRTPTDLIYSRPSPPREERDTPEPEAVSSSFLSSIRQYAMVTALTVGGAYLGFSAARHTDVADELRTMEENPIIKAYQVAHEVETYQKLREWDFLGPEQEKVAERREILESAKKKVGKVGRFLDSLTMLVKDVPLLGRGAALIEEQQHQIRLYEQKQEQYTSTLIKYTTTGTGSGFGMGIFLALSVGRRRKA